MTRAEAGLTESPLPVGPGPASGALLHADRG
jgi:hypothetical protein